MQVCSMHWKATCAFTGVLFHSAVFARSSTASTASSIALVASRTGAQWLGSFLAVIGAGIFLYIIQWNIRSRYHTTEKNPLGVDVQGREPSLLQNHTSFKSYTTSQATYPKIRTFFHPHPQAEKLPQEPKSLPVLIFVHGLGGSLAQFVPLMTGLVNVAPCFGIDLPGCGKSAFIPQDWSAYSHSALVGLLHVIIDEACALANVEEVVLVCHSMGCSLAASLLAGNSSTSSSNANRVKGLIALCPKAALPSIKEVKTFRRLLSIPSPIFDLFRAWDRRGGISSASVSRFVGDSASIETKKMQLRFNEQSKTAVWRRMAMGSVPSIRADGSVSDGLPGPDVWANISVPLLLIAGESDHVTKPSEVDIITAAMGRDGKAEDNKQNKWKAPLKIIILPSPASHGLLYDHATYRIVSGVILTFLSDHVQKELSMSWQLQYLKEANVWDVKNLAKWQSTPPVSSTIGDMFLAMKTLREGDETHSPFAFANAWGSQLKAIVDISQTQPVYNPHDLEKGGVEYHKLPTVSKVPPRPHEVKDFISLVDQLRLEEDQAMAEGKLERKRLIAVHCHYGYNRTGFFICSYLIERAGWSIQKAIDDFAAARPPGIRHEHFLDNLFVRYHIGLKRAPTM